MLLNKSKMDYLKKVDEIRNILKAHGEEKFINQINNAIIMGGTGGEKLAIVCSLLKTYEIQLLDSFDLVKMQAYELYQYAESIGMHPLANFSLLEELSD